MKIARALMLIGSKTIQAKLAQTQQNIYCEVEGNLN